MRVIIAGGGTGRPPLSRHRHRRGGDVAPRRRGAVRRHGARPGGQAGAGAGFPLELLEVSGLKRTGVRGLVRGLLRLPKAFFGSRAILRRFRPDLVIGVGGYASGPIVLDGGAVGLRDRDPGAEQPPGLHQSRCWAGSCAGSSSRSRRAAAIFAAAKTMLSGNPVRRRFLDGARAGAPATPRRDARRCWSSAAARARARSTSWCARWCRSWRARGPLPRIVHQTGPADFERTRAALRRRRRDRRVDRRGRRARRTSTTCRPRSAQASLVIGRAGALTLAELAIVGCPAILIPLPTAADDHQTANARELAGAGAAVVLPQARGDRRGRWPTWWRSLLGDDARRAAMARGDGGAGPAGRGARDRRRAGAAGAGRDRRSGGLMFRKRNVAIHFVGIGGIGMSGIAEVLLNLGYPVSGSDLQGQRRHAPAGVAGREDPPRPRARAGRRPPTSSWCRARCAPTTPRSRRRARATSR